MFQTTNQHIFMVFRNVGCLYHHKMVAYPNTSELPWQTPHDFSHPQCSLRFRQALPSVNAPAFQAAPIRAADHIRAVAAQGRHRILGVCLAKDRMAIRIFSTWICQISPSLCVYLCIYIYIFSTEFWSRCETMMVSEYGEFIGPDYAK